MNDLIQRCREAIDTKSKMSWEDLNEILKDEIALSYMTEHIGWEPVEAYAYTEVNLAIKKEPHNWRSWCKRLRAEDQKEIMRWMCLLYASVSPMRHEDFKIGYNLLSMDEETTFKKARQTGFNHSFMLAYYSERPMGIGISFDDAGYVWPNHMSRKLYHRHIQILVDVITGWSIWNAAKTYEEWFDGMDRNPKILGGKPVFPGTRIPIRAIGGPYLNGDSKETILKDRAYAGITSLDVDYSIFETLKERAKL